MLTNQDIETLNAARTVLKRIAWDAMREAWKAPNSAREDGPFAASYGRLAEAADAANHHCFQVLNVASSYCDVDIPDDRLYNREPDGQRIGEGGTIVATDR